MFVKLGFEFCAAALLACLGMMVSVNRDRRFNFFGGVVALCVALAIVSWGIALWTQT